MRILLQTSLHWARLESSSQSPRITMEVLTRNIISGRVKFRQGIVDIVGRFYENQWKMIQIIHRFFTCTNYVFSFNEKLYLF